MVFVKLFLRSLHYGNIFSSAIIPTSTTICLHCYPIWEVASIDEWLYNCDAYELIVLHFLHGSQVGKPSFCLVMLPWIVVAYSVPIALLLLLLIYPIDQRSFSNVMPPEISSAFNFMIAF